MRQTTTGYPFPNIPGGWSEDGKRFAQGLRFLFDRIFGQMVTKKDINALREEIFPVGIVILTGSNEAPFSFGTWTAVTTGITGVYGFKRTE